MVQKGQDASESWCVSIVCSWIFSGSSAIDEHDSDRYEQFVDGVDTVLVRALLASRYGRMS